MLPSRLTTSELAAAWKVTPTRVTQLSTSGRIKRGEDGRFDRDACMAFRKQQISDDEVRVLFQSVGNRHGTSQPKIFDHLAAERELTSDEVLGIESEASSPALNVIDQAYAKQSDLARLRAEEVHERIRRQKLRSDREEGLLIPRSEVRRKGQEAAKIIISILNALPHELATVFADREARAQVREAVQLRVDQMQHALFNAISAAATEDDDD